MVRSIKTASHSIWTVDTTIYEVFRTVVAEIDAPVKMGIMAALTSALKKTGSRPPLFVQIQHW